MAFIKHGDGKIVSVIEEEELTEDLKKAFDKSKELLKESNKNENKLD